jgi:eukaryotic-like serine/threonine-protein kinase
VALTQGTALGPYQVSALLGAGGMGEVYRARDTRLARDVAIKVLTPSFTNNPDWLKRFEAEARAASAINHPNIVAIYDVGTHEGAPFVVSELLEGESLRTRLQRAPLPARKALEIARQLVAGLAAAHDKGIIHRDLKPENVFITADGRVKILDFGLAKQVATGSSPDLGRDRTASVGEALTEPGAVMGTVGYMAPEQVYGEPADARSDIFVVGALLYEMFWGARAFQRPTGAEAMTAILREEPDGLDEAPPGAPLGIERIVAHCLEKSPAMRFQTARDLGFALDALTTSTGRPATGPTTGRPAPARPPSHGPGATRRTRGPGAEPSPPGTRAGLRSPGLIATMLAALGIAAGVGFLTGRGSAPAPRPPDAPSYKRLTFRQGFARRARFGPDQQTIVYEAAWTNEPARLYLVREGSPESTKLEVPDDVRLLAVSRTEVATLLRAVPWSYDPKGMLALVPLDGGAPREVEEDVTAADFAPDGTLAVAHATTGHEDLELPPHKVVYGTSGWLSDLRFAPDGKRLAFVEHAVFHDDRGRVMIMDVASEKVRPLGREWGSIAGLAWASRREIWVTASAEGGTRSIWALTLGGGPERLVASSPAVMTLEDVASDGRVLLTRIAERKAIFTLAPGQTRERDLAWFDWSSLIDLAADGKTLLITEAGEAAGPSYRTYLRPTDGSPALLLGEGFGSSLSPDGKLVALESLVHPDRLDLVPTGAGEPRALPAGPLEARRTPIFSPSGVTVAFVGHERGRGQRIWLQDISGGPPRPISPEGTTWVTLGHVFSPDGLKLRVRDPAGRPALLPASGGEPTPVPGLEPGEIPIEWTPDGRLLVYSRTRLPLRVFRLDPASGARELAREIVLPITDAADLYALLMTPDTAWYAYAVRLAASDLFLARGLRPLAD